MTALRITIHPPRLWILNHRIHHGLLGLLLLIHDHRDWRHWLSDLARTHHEPRP
jgi:hypothetical protein